MLKVEIIDFGGDYAEKILGNEKKYELVDSVGWHGLHEHLILRRLNEIEKQNGKIISCAMNGGYQASPEILIVWRSPKE